MISSSSEGLWPWPKLLNSHFYWLTCIKISHIKDWADIWYTSPQNSFQIKHHSYNLKIFPAFSHPRKGFSDLHYPHKLWSSEAQAVQNQRIKRTPGFLFLDDLPLSVLCARSKLTCNCSLTSTVFSLFANVLCTHTQRIPLQGSIPVTQSSTVASPAQVTFKHPLVAFERLDWTLFFNNSRSSLNKQELRLFPLKKKAQHWPEQLPKGLIQIFQGPT